MNVVLNGAPATLGDRATVADALAALDLPGGDRGIAVAVDAEVVPRGEWTSTELQDGARIEVVQAVQGG